MFGRLGGLGFGGIGVERSKMRWIGKGRWLMTSWRVGNRRATQGARLSNKLVVDVEMWNC